jgi:hypothetical protein
MGQAPALVAAARGATTGSCRITSPWLYKSAGGACPTKPRWRLPIKGVSCPSRSRGWTPPYSFRLRSEHPVGGESPVVHRRKRRP